MLSTHDTTSFLKPSLLLKASKTKSGQPERLNNVLDNKGIKGYVSSTIKDRGSSLSLCYYH